MCYWIRRWGYDKNTTKRKKEKKNRNEIWVGVTDVLHLVALIKRNIIMGDSDNKERLPDEKVTKRS